MNNWKKWNESEKGRQYQAQWHEKNDPGTGVIGDVPKLAPGAINPMWGIEANLPKIAKRGAEALNATTPKKKKKTTPHSWDFPKTTKPIAIEPELDE